MGDNAALKQQIKALGLTQGELVKRMNNVLESLTGRYGTVSERTVHNLVTGKTSWPQAKIRAALEGVFGCTAEQLGFTPPRSAQRPARPEDSMRRRTLFAAATGSALGAAGMISSRPKVGSADLARLQASFDALVTADNVGDTSLEANALRLAERALYLQQEYTASDRVRSGLYLLSASFTSTAMWAAVDRHRITQAQRHRERAITLAGLSGDSGIQFRIWSHTAILALQRENYTEAVAAAAAARNSSITRKDPLFASLAHARSAGVHATAGDRTAALRSLKAAEKSWDRSEPQTWRPSWMNFYDQAELDGLSAITHIHLGRYAEAEACTHRALAQLRPELRRNHVYYTAQLALTQLLQGDVEQACATALSVAGETTGRAEKTLSKFDAVLGRLTPDSREARSWREYRSNTAKGFIV
ncbi:hypothetical protein [Streptomyces vinaceus]|uniref:hypothetical protein n=1 Tax=Streptomyces vinaceus TaxID=1960 RepID=UPI0036941DC1